MSDAAARYQAQVTGAPPGWVYRVFFGPGPEDYVDFDGFVSGVLLEAKGANLAKFIDDGLNALPFFEGEAQILSQARRQLISAQGTPIRWLIAEKKFADYVRKLFANRRIEGIDVVHVPPLP